MLQGLEPVVSQPIQAAAKRTTTQRAEQNTAQPKASSKPVQKLIASEELLQQWAEVMNQVKGKSVKLHAFLNAATPAAFKNGELILRFNEQYKFHYNSVNQEENLRLIGQVVSQLTGQPAKVMVELENEAGYIPQELTLADEVKSLFGSEVTIEIND
jgi:DNA polymerase-3 subunit gamma/tau